MIASRFQKVSLVTLSDVLVCTRKIGANAPKYWLEGWITSDLHQERGYTTVSAIYGLSLALALRLGYFLSFYFRSIFNMIKSTFTIFIYSDHIIK